MPIIKTCREIFLLSLILSCFHATSYAETFSTESISSTCNSEGGCNTDPDGCQDVCGCDGTYKFDESTGECVLDYEYLKERTRTNNLMHTGDESGVFDDDGWAKKIRERTEKVFQGIIYCGIFFIVCASICVVSVCAFCCRIHYSDRKLKNDVKALAAKLKLDYHKKESVNKKPCDQKGESCNVIVEDANVMCV